MLKRKILNDLINWKNNPKKKPLLITGARQVGKTFIIEKFAQENYKNVISINFIEREDLVDIFDTNLSAENFYKRLSIEFDNMNLIEGETLIFLDEVQVCPKAITALKFLCIYGKYDIIVSGSLLGITYKRVSSFPVGYIDRMEMNSLDFEEFLWANGMNENAINYLKEFYDKREQVPEGIHKKMMDLFKEYIILGGMPEVIEEFVESKNFSNAFKIQKRIIDDYKDDILKYSDENEKVRIRATFDSIPKHLAQDYKKFRYNLIDKNGKAIRYNDSLIWLYDAGIINFCYNLKIPELPFEGNAKNDIFKVYMKDTGLLMAMMEEGSQKEVFEGNLGIYKGAIYENIIADILGKKGKKLYYFEHNSTLEIDFFIKFDNLVTALEVKSGDNTKSKSLNSVMKNYNVKQGIRLSTKNIGYNDNGILSLPLYMAMFL